MATADFFIVPDSYTVNVGTAATRLSGSSSIKQARAFTVTGHSARAIRVGDSGVTFGGTAANGVLVAADTNRDYGQHNHNRNEVQPYDLNQFFAIATVANTTVSVTRYKMAKED